MRHLRIKKKWLLAIEHGEKKIEYRSNIKFYAWLKSSKPPFPVCFHYQTDHRVVKTVYKIRLIKKPAWIDSSLVSTETCFAIYLK